MNETNNLLDKMSLIDPEYVEQASYPAKKKRIGFSRFRTVAACLVLVVALSATAFATGVFDAVRSYFFGENEKVQSLLHQGGQIVKNGNATMRLDCYIADEECCWFTVSFHDFDHPIRTSGKYDLSWIDANGTEYIHFNRQVGAYTKSSSMGFGAGVEATSEYDDADATLIFRCQVPRDMDIREFKNLNLAYEGLTLEFNPADALVPMCALNAVKADDTIRNFKASQIGFYFEAAASCESFDVVMIDKEGKYVQVNQDGFFGYSLSSSFGGEEWMSVVGNWNGGSGITLGIMDLDNYKGIQVNGIDFLLEK